MAQECSLFRGLIFLAFICYTKVFTEKIEIPRPRGISIEHAGLYVENEDKTFTCLDGNKIIRYDQINDDYCDCLDASDEPGTSACPNGYFHCNNNGYHSKLIPSSRINDGLCDCCDGSDEYNSRLVCKNICIELGNEERLQERRKMELVKEASIFKTQMSTKGKEKKTELNTKLGELEFSRTEAEKIRNEKDQIKKDSEAAEKDAIDVFEATYKEKHPETVQQEPEKSNNMQAEEFFAQLDFNQDGFIDASELQKSNQVDSNGDGVISEEEASFYLNKNEKVDRESFLTQSWPLIKLHLMKKSGMFEPPVDDEKQMKPEDAPHKESDNYNYNDIDNNNDDENDHEDEPHTDDEDNDNETEDDDDLPEDSDPDPDTGAGEAEAVETSSKPTRDYDPETQNIVDIADNARKEFADAQKVLNDIDKEINSIKEILSINYGPGEEFSSLNGECFDYQDREYIYSLCPFQKATQRPVSGGSETSLGTWEKWNGNRDNQFSEMLYSGGLSCWNGPRRSTLVRLECGLNHVIKSVTEPNRCEYYYVFETPAACQTLNEANKDNEMRDEL